MRDHREGMDPTPVDITDLVRRMNTTARRSKVRPPRQRPNGSTQATIRKARRKQANASRRANR